LGRNYLWRKRATTAGNPGYTNNFLPAFVREDYPLHWQMAFQEQAAIVQLLDFVAPPVAVEIGTHRGGSLQVIAPRAGRAYALDINPDVRRWLGSRFPNVTFRIGDSRAVLPRVLEEIEAKGEQLGFVLVDGAHSSDGVQQDINAVLRYKPLRPVFIVMHDSFNPGCRAGILAADWQACPHAHYVQLDFVGGIFVPMPNGIQMWGGLGLALLLPQTRTGELTVRQAGKTMFETARAFSIHAAAAA
jgi:hypothetical protein